MVSYERLIAGFRRRRGVLLTKHINEIAAARGRNITILDVGGRAAYWDNVDCTAVARITTLNVAEDFAAAQPVENDLFTHVIGDACDLSLYADRSFDLVHSNSVIEHVGDWDHMAAMAREAVRVGRSGWIQTPAFEFVWEPHFRAPFLHWFGAPLRRKLMVLSPLYRGCDIAERRHHIDRINLLSRAEFVALFPHATMMTERVVLPKSYVATW